MPLHPRDKQEFQLDFPRLVHRYQAVRARREGIGLHERALAPPTSTHLSAIVNGL